MLPEELRVIDAPVPYKRRTRGGALYALEVLDGGTIKRLIDDWGRPPQPPARPISRHEKKMTIVYVLRHEETHIPLRNYRFDKR